MVSIERCDIAGNGASQLIFNFLAHLRVGLVGPITAVIVFDLLHDRGDALLGGYLNVRATDNGENRRSVHVSIAGLTGRIGHEKPVALVQTLKVTLAGIAWLCPSKRLVPLQGLGNQVQNRAIINRRSLSIIRALSRADELRPRLGVFIYVRYSRNVFERSRNEGFHITRSPLNIGKCLIT